MLKNILTLKLEEHHFCYATITTGHVNSRENSYGQYCVPRLFELLP
jgi:hypothetical protein